MPPRPVPEDVRKEREVFGQFLRDARATRSQGQVVKQICKLMDNTEALTVNALSQFEKGKRVPTERLVPHLARALGIEEHDLARRCRLARIGTEVARDAAAPFAGDLSESERRLVNLLRELGRRFAETDEFSRFLADVLQRWASFAGIGPYLPGFEAAGETPSPEARAREVLTELHILAGTSEHIRASFIEAVGHLARAFAGAEGARDPRKYAAATTATVDRLRPVAAAQAAGTVLDGLAAAGTPVTDDAERAAVHAQARAAVDRAAPRKPPR